MKSYTDLEQSRKLAEILPIESADMYYINGNTITICKWEDDTHDEDDVPAWSLAALLGVIPNYKLNSKHGYYTCIAETSFDRISVAWFDNQVDACYQMILTLHELKLL